MPGKLGAIKPKARPQALRMEAYLDWNAVLANPPPAVVDYTGKAAASLKQMYANDQWGDCVIAGKMHALGIWSGNDSDSGGVVLASEKECVDQYHAICGAGDPGCVITDVLDVMRGKGLVAGGKTYRIDGYVSVDHTNKLAVQVALYLFGSLSIGLDLPQAWYDAPEGGIWDTTGTATIGGHDVTAVGYGPVGVTISTWGGLRTITWAALTSSRWIFEVYASLAPLWYGSDKLAPSGFNAKVLAEDLAKMSGGVIPDPGPPPTPPTPPTPPVPPPLPVFAATMTTDEVLRAGHYWVCPAVPPFHWANMDLDRPLPPGKHNVT